MSNLHGYIAEQFKVLSFGDQHSTHTDNRLSVGWPFIILQQQYHLWELATLNTFTQIIKQN